MAIEMKKLLPVIFLAIGIAISQAGCKKKEVPLVETIAVSNITETFVACGGNVTSDGGDVIISRGVCWSKNENPTTADNKTADGTGAGYFPSLIKNLEPGVVYYFTAYAINSSGTGYGEALEFKTLGEAPSASLCVASDITATSARITASINPNYASTVITIEYGTTTDYGSSVASPQSPINGHTAVYVTADLTSLSAATTYHYRVKAVNSLGTVYSSDFTFKTLGKAPSVTGLTCSNRAISSFTVYADINPNYVPTTVTYEYGTTSSYGNSVSALQNPYTGNSSIRVTAAIPNLAPATLYHIRVKAENSVGITYSSDITATTLGQSPVAVTRNATNITASSATLQGIVNPNYLTSTVTFEYGITSSFGSTISAEQNIGTGNSPVSVTASLTGLTESQIYYFRVRAENELGVSIGNTLTFVPGSIPTSVTDIEGNVYPVVQVGTQFWMAENLKTKKYNDNSSVPNITDGATWIALTTPGYCWYNNDEASYKNTYGALYNFYAVSTGKLCPIGWHVPTDAEFTTFTNALGNIDYAGGKIKEAGTTHWLSPNTGATNETGFTALPAGYTTDAGSFDGISRYEAWWTSTPYNVLKPWYRSVGYETSAVEVRNGSLNQRGFSVRCIKD